MSEILAFSIPCFIFEELIQHQKEKKDPYKHKEIKPNKKNLC
jgi:hypothetical protein